MRKLLGTFGTATVVLAAQATASERTTTVLESLHYTNIESHALAGDMDNIVRTDTLAGGYAANGIRLRGQLQKVLPNTFASEADLRMTTTAGTFDLNGSTTNSYTDTIDTETLLEPGTFDPAGPVSIEFFESYDDGPGADQVWNSITIDLLQTTVTNGHASLGLLPGDGSLVSDGGHNVAGGLDFYQIELGGPGVIGGGFLNIQTRDPLTGDAIDTELALYDASGAFVATDDDGQAGGLGELYSMLSFGADDPYAPGGSDAVAGEDGAVLAPGVYTVVVGGFNTVFGGMLDQIEAGTAEGDYELDVRYAVPEPGTLSLAGLVGLGLLGRRGRGR